MYINGDKRGHLEPPLYLLLLDAIAISLETIVIFKHKNMVSCAPCDHYMIPKNKNSGTTFYRYEDGGTATVLIEKKD